MLDGFYIMQATLQLDINVNKIKFCSCVPAYQSTPYVIFCTFFRGSSDYELNVVYLTNNPNNITITVYCEGYE